jgi:hypothetical protein
VRCAADAPPPARRHLAKDHGIGSLLLVPPFYAARRAQDTPASAAAAAKSHGKHRRLRKGQHADVAQLLLTGLVAAEEVRHANSPLTISFPLSIPP